MKRFSLSMMLLGLVTSVTVIASVVFPGAASSVNAKGRPNSGFSERSLSGSYASSGAAGGFASRSIGVTTFDGRGGVERFVTINAGAEGGGRQLIYVVSTGTYSVGPEGIGSIEFLNTFSSGSTSTVNYDFVINKSSRGGRNGAVQANEITGIQREAGVTASPVEEFWTRREGL
ncbi:hypothetical protein OAG34_01085 [bacterium]|jgi:hypothetical protein|nr:hypothetical protein [bacterium]